MVEIHVVNKEGGKHPYCNKPQTCLRATLSDAPVCMFYCFGVFL